MVGNDIVIAPFTGGRPLASNRTGTVPAAMQALGLTPHGVGPFVGASQQDNAYGRRKRFQRTMAELATFQAEGRQPGQLHEKQPARFRDALKLAPAAQDDRGAIGQALICGIAFDPRRNAQDRQDRLGVEAKSRKHRPVQRQGQQQASCGREGALDPAGADQARQRLAQLALAVEGEPEALLPWGRALEKIQNLAGSP